MINIKKQLAKVDIVVNIDKNDLIFTMSNGTKKTIKQKEIEQYLFICLLDFVEDAK
jgi:hypothetical protein